MKIQNTVKPVLTPPVNKDLFYLSLLMFLKQRPPALSDHILVLPMMVLTGVTVFETFSLLLFATNLECRSCELNIVKQLCQ